METAALISSSVEVVPITVELDVDRSLESVELLLSVRCWPTQLKEEGWSWRMKIRVLVRVRYWSGELDVIFVSLSVDGETVRAWNNYENGRSKYL